MAKRGRPEDQTLARIDDALAGLSGVFPAVAAIIARQRINLTRRDVEELERIVSATARARDVLIVTRQHYTEGT